MMITTGIKYTNNLGSQHTRFLTYSAINPELNNMTFSFFIIKTEKEYAGEGGAAENNSE